ncbi:MAG: DUF4350 domain-containing protein [Holophagales bacterium]|nr:DUF4350 domain-containing protein [Holophagales bacterium]
MTVPGSTGFGSPRAWGAVALALAAFFAARAFLFEKVTVTVDTGYSGEAAYDPFFAARRLFSGLGAEARSITGLSKLPPAGSVLWLAPAEGVSRQEDTERLLRWTRDGGHLVLDATHSAEPFLEAGGWRLESEGSARPAPEPASTSKRSAGRDDPSPLHDLPPWPRLVSLAPAESLDEPGELSPWFRTGPLGSGRLTAAVSLSVFTNDSLAEKQHAQIAWWLVSPDGPPAEIWVAAPSRPPSVWALLVSRGRPIALALGALALVGLALFARPFGPRLPSDPRDRRHLAEHLRATGDFLWRHEVEHVLLDASRAAALERCLPGREPTSARLAELAEQKAADLGLSPAQILDALKTPSTRDRRTMVETIRVLETLRRSP